ncbi:MAG: HEPN domain-containing protein [Actinomycetota bacterium]
MTPGQIEEARAELRRAEQALAEAKLLFGAASLEGAASRLYYSAFHATRAALLVRGLSAKTHSGQIALFTDTYGAVPLLGRLLDLRARADYELGESIIARETVEQHVADAERFLTRCTEAVERAAAGGADEPDPPADR